MYISIASPTCFMLLRQLAFFAASLARVKTGKRMAASIAMMAITTRSSMRVKARRTVEGIRVQGLGSRV